MNAEIQNVKVTDLVGKGYFTVTYAHVDEQGKFGVQARLLVKDKTEENTYGLTVYSKQIIEQARDPSLVGKRVKFKSYPTTNGNVTYKMFPNDYQPKTKE